MGLLLLTTVLNADFYEKECLKDLESMSNSYYSGIKLEYQKSYDLAVKSLHESIESSYMALKSCEKIEHYDLNSIYSYMTSSELKINQLQESMQ